MRNGNLTSGMSGPRLADKLLPLIANLTPARSQRRDELASEASATPGASGLSAAAYPVRRRCQLVGQADG
jgi:hypothetical protein